MAALRGLAVLVGLLAPASLQAQQDPVVRAVLFFSPTCPHCHKVMQEDLPPLTERYGEQFVIVGVDVTKVGGQALFQATADHFDIPPMERGVPMLLIGEELLSGGIEIPERLPGMVERALAEDGIEWPSIPLVREALAQGGLLDEESPRERVAEAAGEAEQDAADSAETGDSAGVPAADSAETGSLARATEQDTAVVAAATSAPPEREPAEAERASAPPDRTGDGTAAADMPAPGSASPGASGTPSPDPATPAPPPGITRSLTSEGDAAVVLTWVDRIRRDPVGNGIAVAVLVGLVLVLVASTWGIRAPGQRSVELPAWLVPALSIVGIGVAAYLSFVEVSGHEAVCGPVGDCNTVQQSSYARLFGVLPVGVLGLVGYVAMLGAWGVWRGGPRELRRPALWSFWTMAFFATAFSVYLTFLEPFVIGATCAWCISSAVIVALLLLVATAGVREAVA